MARGDAIISHCGRHRYLLTREWAPGPTATFIMLNPSTADASEDDPTIRRCVGFAKREGYGRLAVVNLYSMRATDPAEVRRAMWPNGPDAAQHLAAALSAADGPVICAWGADPVAIGRRDLVLGMVRDAGKTPMCLGMSKHGAPRHPLYLPGDTPLVEFIDPPRDFRRRA